MKVPQDLAKFGFGTMPEDPLMRMLVGSQGLDKTGKSHFGLTAPDPIAVINMDFGLQGMGEKFVKEGKTIWPINVPIPVGASGAKYIECMKRSVDAYQHALGHKDVRSVLIDDATQWWELARLAEFGTLNPSGDVKKLYNQLNQYFRGLIKAAYETDKNLILTHKVGKLYAIRKTPKGDVSEWDGSTYVREGFKEDGFLIQVNIEHTYRGGLFGIRVINCRHNMGIAGFELPQQECSFADLGALVFECDRGMFL